MQLHPYLTPAASADTLKQVLALSARGAPMDQLLLALAQAAGQLSFGGRAAIFTRCSPSQLELRASCGLADEFIAAINPFPIGAERPSCGRVAATGQAAIVEDISTDPACQPWLALAQRHDMAAVWSFPLQVQPGEVLGTLAIYQRQCGAPDAVMRAELDYFANVASLVIDRQHLMEQTQRRNRLYETFLQNTPDLAYVFDLEHRFIYANEVLLRMWDKTWEEAIGKTCLELGYEPWHAEMHSREIELVKATKKPIQGEVPFNGSFGRRVYDYIFVPVLGPDGEVEAVAGTTRDFTERKLTEEALAASQAHLASMFEQTAVGIVEIGSDLRFRGGNPHFCEMMGFSREELTQKGVTDVTHPDDLAQTLTRLSALQDTGQPFTIEKRYVRPDGGILWANSSVSRIRGEAPGTDSMLVVVQDISALRTREQELREAGQRKDEFLAMLAHELRNPLAPITTAAELLCLREDTESARPAGEVILRQVRHMTGLVDDLLDVSRVTRGLITLQWRPLDLVQVARDAMEQVRPLLDARRHRTQLNLPPRSLTMVGDHKRLVQVVANLLNNAAKYTDEGGVISLTLEQEPAWLSLSVRDTGRGMSPELIARAFELFVQSELPYDRRAQGGLGLGLALVKSLVQLHGGSVTAHSDGPGQGAEFRLRLPASAGELPRTPPPALAATGPGGAQKILVVDDNPDAAEMLSLLLRACGHTVRTECDPHAALAVAPQWQPRVCLLDIGMPGMDGMQLARALRADPALDGCTLVAVTGYGSPQDREQSAQAGFDHHLVKPVDLQALHAVLAQLKPA